MHMLRSLRVFAIVVSPLIAFGAVACSRDRSAPKPEPIRPDPPALSASASAQVDAAPPPEPPSHAMLPGVFDRFDTSGRTFTVDVPTMEQPETIVTFDAATLRETKRRAIRKGAVAWSYGGSIQIIVDGKALVRVFVDDARTVPIPASLVAPNEDGGGSLSDDGRLFAYGDLTVYDLDAARAAYTFEAPCAGGPLPVAVVAPSGSFALGVCRGESFAKLTGAKTGAMTWQYSVADHHLFSIDEKVLLEGPYYPFAMDWVKSFVVRDVATGKTLRTLSPTIEGPDVPYTMALSAHGDLAAILVKGKIDFYRTSDGKKLGTQTGPDADKTTIVFSPMTDALFMVHADKLEIITTPRP
jgi:hypothetical protein